MGGFCLGFFCPGEDIVWGDFVLLPLRVGEGGHTGRSMDQTRTIHSGFMPTDNRQRYWRKNLVRFKGCKENVKISRSSM